MAAYSLEIVVCSWWEHAPELSSPRVHTYMALRRRLFFIITALLLLTGFTLVGLTPIDPMKDRFDVAEGKEELPKHRGVKELVVKPIIFLSVLAAACCVVFTDAWIPGNTSEERSLHTPRLLPGYSSVGLSPPLAHQLAL
jgi:hypothetical protein